MITPDIMVFIISGITVIEALIIWGLSDEVKDLMAQRKSLQHDAKNHWNERNYLIESNAKISTELKQAKDFINHVRISAETWGVK